MNDDEKVGQAVWRENRGRRTTSRHLVQSMVAGAAITKCGYRMEPKAAAGPLTFAPAAWDGQCYRCW